MNYIFCLIKSFKYNMLLVYNTIYKIFVMVKSKICFRENQQVVYLIQFFKPIYRELLQCTFKTWMQKQLDAQLFQMSWQIWSRLGTSKADSQRVPWLHQGKLWPQWCIFMLETGKNSPQFYPLWGLKGRKCQLGWTWASLRRISWMGAAAMMVALQDMNFPQGDQGSSLEAEHGRGLVRWILVKVAMMLFWWLRSHTRWPHWRSCMHW